MMVEQINFLNQYLEIEKIRLHGKIRFKEEIKQEVLKAPVPNFILQPLVEELIYKTASVGSSTCELFIRAFRENDRLKIIIENSIGQNETLNDLQVYEGTVFKITKKRLTKLFGDEQKMIFTPNRNGTVVVEINIPLREKYFETEVVYLLENAV